MSLKDINISLTRTKKTMIH